MNSQAQYLSEDPTKHIVEAVPFFRSLGYPQGFKPLLTKDAKVGQTVYLMGSTGTEDHKSPQAYGPHTVVDPERGHRPAKIWLKNKQGTLFPINQEELLEKYEPAVTIPWGPRYSTKELATGVWLHSSSGHGGLELSPDNQETFLKYFPEFTEQGAQFLEDVWEILLAMTIWPKAFAPYEVLRASDTLEGLSQKYEKYKGFQRFKETPAAQNFQNIVDQTKAEVADKWQITGTCTRHPKPGLTVLLRHRSTKEEKHVHLKNLPYGIDFLSEEELKNFTLEPA